MSNAAVLLNKLIEPKQQIPEDRKRFSNTALKNLIVPIIIEQFLALLVGIADTLMVSHVGETAVSAVSLVNQLNNVFIMVFTALASGGAVVASQYMGAGDIEGAGYYMRKLLRLTYLGGAVWNLVFFPVAFSVSNGIRAAGDVKYTMYVSIFSTVICRTAFAVLFGVVCGLGVVGVTSAMICDWAIKAGLILLRWKSGKWKHFKVI